MRAKRTSFSCLALIVVLSVPQTLLATVSSRPHWCTNAEPYLVTPSRDSRWLVMTTPSTSSLSLFDSTLNPVRRYAVTTREGNVASSVYAIYDAPARQSYIVVPRDIAELWEISYNPRAEPIYDGLVHDYRMGEAIAQSGFLGVRRTVLTEPLRDLFFDVGYRHAISISRSKLDGKLYANVINLDVRRSIGSTVLHEPVPTTAGFAVTWVGGTVTTVHGPVESKEASVGAVRRYCAP